MGRILSDKEIKKNFRIGLNKDISLQAINHFAKKLGYFKKRGGAKIGYDQSLYTLLTSHLKELMDYDAAMLNKSPQKPLKQPQIEPNYFMMNGERDNKDYEWEADESLITKYIIEAIEKLDLYKNNLIFEGNDNEKRAKNYIRQANICDNEEQIQLLFDYIRNVFSSSDSKSYNYKHIQGIVKMVLNGCLTYDAQGNIIKNKNGVPILDDEKLFKLIQRIEITSDLENSNNTKYFDNSFRKTNTNLDNTYDEFVNPESLPTKYEYINNLIKKLIVAKTNNGYSIIRIPNFSVAKMFSIYAPDICYLHRISKYNTYGGDNRIFLAIKDNYNDVVSEPMKKSIFRTKGKFNSYATSIIGIAIKHKDTKKLPYEIVTINSRYSWHVGSTNYDYNFDELSNILGLNVKKWLSELFNTDNFLLNKPSKN